MVDLAPFIYLALVTDVVAILVVACICYLVGSYLYRTFSGRLRGPISTLKSGQRKHPERHTPLDISPQPRNA